MNKKIDGEYALYLGKFLFIFLCGFVIRLVEGSFERLGFVVVIVYCVLVWSSFMICIFKMDEISVKGNLGVISIIK